MNLLVIAFASVNSKTFFFTDHHQLGVYVSPLSHSHEREKVLTAILSELTLGSFLALALIALPKIHQVHKIGLPMMPLSMGLIGFLLRGNRSLSWVLHSEATGYDQHFL